MTEIRKEWIGKSERRVRQNPVGKSYRLARSKENLLRARRLKIEMPTRKAPPRTSITEVQGMAEGK